MKKISGTDRNKVLKIIDKIELGNFDENDVDGLLMKLRAYSEHNGIFKEIAHFVAHNDVRNQGLTHEALELSYFSLKYLLTYKTKNPKFEIYKPFPSYIKKLMEYQLKNIDNKYFQNTFKFNKEEFVKKLSVFFINDVDNCIIDIMKFNSLDSSYKNNFIKGVHYVMSYLNYPPIYTQTNIINSFIETIQKNEISFSKVKFKAQGDKIMLCILYLLHNTKYNLKSNGFGCCKINFSKSIRTSELKETIDIVEIFNEPIGIFDNLLLNSEVSVEFGGVPYITHFNFMVTNLNAGKWCSKSLLSSLKVIPRMDVFNEGPENTLIFDAELGESITINEDFMLDKA